MEGLSSSISCCQLSRFRRIYAKSSTVNNGISFRMTLSRNSIILAADAGPTSYMEVKSSSVQVYILNISDIMTILSHGLQKYNNSNNNKMYTVHVTDIAENGHLKAYTASTTLWTLNCA